MEFVRENIPNDDVHGLGHVMRVRNMAVDMARKLGADVEVVEIASLLHDIARGSDDHALEGGKIARDFLEKLGFDRIDEVVHAIETHSFSSGREPETLEAKILSDADKIDALGYIGVYRVICHGCREGRSLKETLRHFREKLVKLPDLMYTDIGRRIALERVEIVRDFLEGIERELGGWSG